MSTDNIGFYEDLTKIIFELSSNIINTHLISSAVRLRSFKRFHITLAISFVFEQVALSYPVRSPENRFSNEMTQNLLLFCVSVYVVKKDKRYGLTRN